MRRLDKIRQFSANEMADFILTLIEDTENNMLDKLATYGLEVSVVSLDPQIRHAQILKDLLEDEDATDT